MGKARITREGSDLTVVTWGAMVERAEQAAEEVGGSIEILDLRTVAPWDREAVLASVEKTGRCLIVHEDTLTAGFGAEVAAVVASDAFFWLDAPVARIAIDDVPTPYNPALMAAVVPAADRIAARMRALRRAVERGEVEALFARWSAESRRFASDVAPYRLYPE